MRAILLATVFLLASCASSKEVYLPDGSKGYSITCSMRFSSFADCEEEAGKLCGAAGYKIYDKGIETGSISSVGGGYGPSGGGFEGSSHTTANRNLLIACNS